MNDHQATPAVKSGLRALREILAKRETETLLTPAQLGRRWGVHTITLRRWVRDGRIKCMKLGRAVRFSQSEVERIERESAV